jgi:REP element-mobilizing transposase RayT
MLTHGDSDCEGIEKFVRRTPQSCVGALAYLITFSCYGSHISGGAGCVDRNHNAFGTRLPDPNPVRETWIRNRMKTDPYLLDASRREIVLESIQSVCEYRKWHLHAAHVRTNHIHAVISADVAPEAVLNSLKSYGSRALNQREHEARRRWARHGSTRYLWTRESIADSIEYVVCHQGKPLTLYQSRHA